MDYWSLLPFIGAVVIAALTGALFPTGDWYKGLVKPSFTPPDWLFGPAWAVIYSLIAVAGWLVWRVEGFGLLFVVWVVQLIFNAAWSWIMFGRRQIGWAMVDVVLMWLSIALFIALAWPTYPIAAGLFVIYLAWVTFAAALNWRIWQLNGTAT